MRKMNRVEARRLGRKTYYTGLPCVHGHTTYRYTQSGTCSACIAAHVAATRRPARASTLARQAALNHLAEIRVRAFDDDAGLILDTAREMALSRYPVLTGDDVMSRHAPIDRRGETALYRVLVPLADIELIREIAAELLHAHGPAETVRSADLRMVG